jgi:hypothetical protein
MGKILISTFLDINNRFYIIKHILLQKNEQFLGGVEMKKLVMILVVLGLVNVASADLTGMVWVSINDPGFTGQMSKYETTNAQYCQFLNAAKASGDITVSGSTVYGANGTNPGEDFDSQVYYDLAGAGYNYCGVTGGGAARINYSGGVFSVDSGFENHPVTYVNWYGATAFCNYYGYRLPSEWEWRAVADYDGSYPYPCGLTINNSIANYCGSTHPYGTTSVGAFGTYGYGMCDMAGNVWELTSSLWDPPQDGDRSLCGLCWANLCQDFADVWKTGEHPYTTDGTLGFRVVAFAIEALVDIDPDTFNLKSKGKWITCYIELPEGYDVADIDVSTIILNGQVPAESRPTAIADYDGDGIADLMVKFSRSAVQKILPAEGEAEITVVGELADGTAFEGKDTIRVISP